MSPVSRVEEESGVWSFRRDVLARYRAWHRRIGKLYVLCALAGGLSGLAMAVFSMGGATALWRISDPAIQSQIGEFFASRPIYLADGHHRYEAARQYQLDRHAEDSSAKAANLAHNFVMMTLIAFEDTGLMVLPYHRILGGLSPDKLSQVRQRYRACRQRRGIERGFRSGPPVRSDLRGRFDPNACDGLL